MNHKKRGYEQDKIFDSIPILLMSAVGRRAEPSGKRYRVGRFGSSDGSVCGRDRCGQPYCIGRSDRYERAFHPKSTKP